MKIDSDNYEKRWYECTNHKGETFLCWPNAGRLWSVIPEIKRPFEFDDFKTIAETDRHPIREIVETLKKDGGRDGKKKHM